MILARVVVGRSIKSAVEKRYDMSENKIDIYHLTKPEIVIEGNSVEEGIPLRISDVRKMLTLLNEARYPKVQFSENIDSMRRSANSIREDNLDRVIQYAEALIRCDKKIFIENSKGSESESV